MKQISSILENFEDAFFHLNSAYQLGYANRAAANLAQLPAEELVGRAIFDLLPFLRDSSLEAACRQAGEKGQVQHFQHLGSRNNHSYEVSVYPAAEGTVVRIADRTEKIRAGQQQRETQERFYLALEAAQMITWEWVIESDRLDISGDFTLFYGIQHNPRGEDVLRLVHPEDAPDHLAKINQATQDGRRYTSVFRIRRPDTGEIIWVEERGMGVAGEDGQVYKLIAVAMNITARKQVEEALRISEERFRLASRAVPGVLYDWSIDREEVYQSEGLERVIGYRQNEAPASKKDWWPSNIHPEDNPRVQAELNAAIEGRTDSFSYEYRIRHKDGHWVWILDQGYIVRDAGGQASRVVGTCTDISERVQAEQQIRTYAEQLERSNRELQEFAFVASHDLQEPLRKIQMFGESLRASLGARLPDDAAESLNRMQRAAQRMQVMINGLLELSRVNTRGGSFEMTDLDRVIEEVLSDLEPRLQASGGRVERGSLPAAQVDSMQMRQLFQNLIGNALKFQPPGQAPLVTVTSQPAQLGKTPAVTIQVADNGIGFDIQYAERIFQPFQRLIGRSQYEGTGMGLAICHKIVERHHGKIEVRSQPGQGTTFLVTLPLKQRH